ncbi:hypothetical protein AB0E54_25105, partial [Amycolatopsis coloradensis]|uniref:hypothetical protein n=1 Tax=Amycolatopsis coloradensis TaxID=76021 RepID=UPI0033E7483E
MTEDGGAGRTGRANALETGREAVRAAIAGAVDVRAITSETGEQYLAEMQQLGDEYALHEWVQGYEMLAPRICRYPGCFEPPRPRTEGTKGGARPQYCEVVRDAHGEPAHTAPKSFAFRRQLEAGGPREPVAAEASNSVDARPVASARAMVPATVERLAELLEGQQAAISGHLDTVRRSMALLGDDEARQVEFEAIQAEADKKIRTAQDEERQANQRARKAEAEAARAAAAEREALQAAQEMAELVEQTENRRAEQESLDQGRVENAQQAEQAAVQAMETANQRATAAEADRDKKVKAAEDKATAEIRKANELADQRTKAAEDKATAEIRKANELADQRTKAAEDKATAE